MITGKDRGDIDTKPLKKSADKVQVGFCTII